MNGALIAAGVLVAIAALYVLQKTFSPVSAFASTGGAGNGLDSGSEGQAPDSSTVSPPSGVAMQWNGAIASAAKAAGIDPALLKAICATETGFNPDAINPEKDFILNGTSYGQYDRAGQRLLVAWIKDGNSPSTIGLDPSCGIAQVRVDKIKKFFSSGVDAWDLFDPSICLEAAAFLIAGDGTTVETADMYNVGHGLNWLRGVRNAPYQKKVASYYAQFVGDF